MKKNVYMVQVNYTNIWNGVMQYWMPYSVGRLVAQAITVPQIKENFDFTLLFKRENPDDVIARMEDPVLVGFSMYVWNINYQLTLARKIKEKWPECVIVFGGPNSIPSQQRAGDCDIVVDGEGELHFCNILMDLLKGNLESGEIDIERIKHLTNLASPYTSGVFDNIVKENPDARWLTTFESDRGCPYQCTFCDWGGLTQSKIRKYDIQGVLDDITWMSHNNVVYIFGANANFGVFPERDLPIARHLRECADQDYCQFESVNLQYLKQNTETAMMIEHILGDLTKGLTLSRQSDSDEVLKAIKRRNITHNKYEKQVKLGEQYNIHTYTEFILPLPLETLDSFRAGLANCLEHGQHTSIDIWPAGLLPKAEMDSKESHALYEFEWVECEDFAKNNLQIDDYDDDVTTEKTKIIVATNTMPREHTKESYLFGWFLIRMHYCGYGQIVSRYLNGKHGVSYLDFYLRFQEKFRQHEAFQEAYGMMNDYIDTFTKYGKYKQIPNPKLRPKMGHHFVTGMARTFCYEYKDLILDIAIETAKEFHDIPEEVEKLQRVYVFDENAQYPQTFELDYDFFNHEAHDVKFTVRDQKVTKYEKFKDDTVVDDNMGMIQRRQGYRCFLDLETDRVYEKFNVKQRIETAFEAAEIKLLEKEGKVIARSA